MVILTHNLEITIDTDLRVVYIRGILPQKNLLIKYEHRSNGITEVYSMYSHSEDKKILNHFEINEIGEILTTFGYLLDDIESGGRR